MKLDIIWNHESYLSFISYLHQLSEENYKVFNERIISTKYEMLGIRLPILRKLASEIFKGDYRSFLKVCDESYYEIVLIRGFILAKIKEIDEFMTYFYSYLTLIDNWAINDSFCASLKIVNKHKEYFLNVIDELIHSSKTYFIRVGLLLLLDYYVDHEYLKIIFHYLDELKSDEYYVNMAEAWLVCEIFIYDQEQGLIYLRNNKLNSFTMNKAISKIRDSYRVSKEIKEEILKLKKLA